MRENIFRFWQKRMEIFIHLIDPGAWNAIVKRPSIPTKEMNGDVGPKECKMIKKLKTF